jgi:hypothetical protein
MNRAIVMRVVFPAVIVLVMFLVVYLNSFGSPPAPPMPPVTSLPEASQVPGDDA